MKKHVYINWIITSLFIITISILIFAAHKFSTQIYDLNLQIKDLTLKVSHEKSTCKMLRENLLLNCNNKEVNIEDFKLYYDGDTTLLSEYAQSPKTVFFFSERHCQQCVEAELEIITKIENISNFLIITDVKRQKYINILKKMSDDKLKIYCSNFDYGQLDVSRYQAPFYFKINKDLKLLSSFFPDKQNAYLSREYLQE